MKFSVLRSSNLYMKKILLLSAILLGAVSASHAGVRLSFGLPLPPLPHVTLGVPPVVVDAAPVAPYYDYAPPVYDAPVVVAPPVVSFGFGYRDYYPRYHSYYPRYYGHRYYGHSYPHHGGGSWHGHGHGRW
jgi:hypothetical protein